MFLDVYAMSTGKVTDVSTGYSVRVKGPRSDFDLTEIFGTA